MSEVTTDTKAPETTEIIDDVHPQNVKDFMGHKIILNPRNWEFTVEGPEFDDSKYKIAFSSYKAAREEITKRTKETALVKAKNAPLNIRAFNEKGELIHITSINRRNGSAAEGRHVYPGLSWVKKALQNRIVLRKELTETESRLDEIRVSTDRSFGGRIAPENYEETLNNFVTTFSRVEERAKQIEAEDAEAEAQRRADVGTPMPVAPDPVSSLVNDLRRENIQLCHLIAWARPRLKGDEYRQTLDRYLANEVNEPDDLKTALSEDEKQLYPS